MRPAVIRAVKQFLEATTLHGFKYLSSPFWFDRVWWVVGGCASACCGGVLCAVLLTRFLQTPALLAVLDTRDADHTLFPVLAVCPSPLLVAQLFEQKMSTKELPNKVYVPTMFFSLLRGHALTPVQIDFLEHVLTAHNMTLVEALCKLKHDALSSRKYSKTRCYWYAVARLELDRTFCKGSFSTQLHVTQPCHSLMRVCRWRNRIVPCDQLFYKEMTKWGVCCMTRSKIFDDKDDNDASTINRNLDLLLQFSDKSVPNSCEFYTKYDGEEAVLPVALTIGYNYRAQLTYTAIKDSSKEKLIDIKNCVSQKEYSAEICIIKCKEQMCKCSDPLTPLTNDEEFPDCTVRQMNCLKTVDVDAKSCGCLPSCRKIVTRTMLEGNHISEHTRTVDPLFTKVNASSTVFSVWVRNAGSKTLALMYNDTWWSLLSSLGGVFNMFLGVGLFSVLELVFLLAARLPRACCRSRSTHLPVPVPPPSSDTVTEIQ